MATRKLKGGKRRRKTRRGRKRRRGGRCCPKPCPCSKRMRRGRKGKRSRRRRRRRRTRGGGRPQMFLPLVLPKGSVTPLNKKVFDPPVPNTVPLQKGGGIFTGMGGLLENVPGYSDLRDMYRVGVNGVKNVYNTAKGDRRLKSPLPDKDQYKRLKPMKRDDLDLGNIVLGAERQASRYRIN